MSTETHPRPSAERAAERAALAAAAHRRGVRAATEYAVGVTWYVGIWFWAIAIVVGATILVVMQRNGDVDVDAVNSVMDSARFFLFVLGIVVPLSMVALHVAAGGTRRSFTHGLWLSGVVVGVSYGLAVAAVGWFQWWLFTRNGWSATSAQHQLYADGSEVGLVLLVQSLLCATYFLAGVVIALGYYRAGFWGGTALVPVAVVPAALAEISLQSGWFGRALADWVGLAGAPVWAATLGGLAAFTLAALLVRAVLRNLALRPVEFAASVARG
ncbi:hypothetical protein [Cellulosimicrobium arenosum]|uniref:Uncharacterized protein n=1 Tax=Cellulosimicrobium arenosum TaxID=2708133 RepID=A0A927J0U8_9MICO|nr:hypothetical protein [Cellulosimicrobium arenosum]MBD8079737.1 hypothetical protein [Cellulosimicrobium arenosum]